MRVCYFGTYEKDYPGNRCLIEGLKLNGVAVIECHKALWERIIPKPKEYFAFGSLLKLGIRYIYCCITLSLRFLRIKRIDIIIVGFNGHLDLLLAKILSIIKSCPLIFNPMLSIYDTIVIDKRFFKENSIMANMLLLVEKLFCKFPHAIFLDCKEHMKIFNQKLKVTDKKLKQLFWGADDKVFFPREPIRKDGKFRVLFYGKYQPTQGVPYVVEAANLLRNYKDIEFEIIGNGVEFNRTQQITRSLNLNNANFIKWVEFAELPTHIADSDICLGMFGTSPKMRRCIPNKVIQAIAMKKPVITGESPAMRELFTDKENILFCKPGDPKSIADAILTLKENVTSKEKIALNGYELFQNKLRMEITGKDAKKYCKEILET